MVNYMEILTHARPELLRALASDLDTMAGSIRHEAEKVRYLATHDATVALYCQWKGERAGVYDALAAHLRELAEETGTVQSSFPPAAP